MGRPAIAFAVVAASLAAAPARAAGVDAGEAERGSRLFATRCVVCHGAHADGQGQLGKLLDPKPANLRASRLTRSAREDIIRHGGAAVGRSAAMPRWEAELDEQELRDVIAYVASIAPAGSRP